MTTPPKPASAERSLEERERLDYEDKPRAPLSVIEEPELELEALTPLVEPSHERPVGFEPRSELIVEGPASLEPSFEPSFEPLSVPSVDTLAEQGGRVFGGEPELGVELSAQGLELEAQHVEEAERLSAQPTLVTPEEPFGAPEAPLFPPRGSWRAGERSHKSKPRLMKGPSRKLGESGAHPLRQRSEGKEGETAALAPRAHASAALLDPTQRGERKKQSATPSERAFSLSSSGVASAVAGVEGAYGGSYGGRREAHVKPDQLDEHTAAALAALEVELSETLSQMQREGGAREGSGAEGAPRPHTSLKVASWGASLPPISLDYSELKVTQPLELPPIFVAGDEREGALSDEGVIGAISGEPISRALDLNTLPPEQVSASLERLFGREPAQEEAATPSPNLWAERSREAPPLKAGARVGEQGWVLDGLLNKVQGVETWLARAPSGEGVVVKLAHPSELSDGPMAWVFDAELRMQALQNLNRGVAQQPLAWGDEPTLKRWYATLEWVEGQSVAELTKRAPLSLSQGRDLFARLAEGLASVHAQGVVHRKIQPSHIILGPEGPKLISFQWVDEVEGEDLQRKQQGIYQALRARPLLLAPEWMEDGQITTAADVYALAASLLVSLVPDAQSWLNAPPSLRIALASAMHPEPELRSSARELARDLRLSARRYLYRGERDRSQMIERLLLGEVVERVLEDELSWHTVAREGNAHPSEGAPELSPWGEVEEVAEAVARAREVRSAERRIAEERAQPQAPLRRSREEELEVLKAEGSLSAYVEDLERQLNELHVALQSAEQRATLQEEAIARERDELRWRDEALRALDDELRERELSLEEERGALNTLRERFEQDEERAQASWREARQALEVVDAEREALKRELERFEAREQSLTEREGELKAQADELRSAREALEQERTQERERLERLYQEAKQGLLEQEAARLISRRQEEARHAERAEREVRLEEGRAFALEREEALEAEQARLAELDGYLEELQREREERLQAKREALRPFRVEPTLPQAPLEPPQPGEQLEVEVGEARHPLRFCPAGVAWIGAEEGDGRPEERPQHKVKLTEGFWCSETPITQRLWEQVMLKNPSQFVGGSRPVEGLSWLEAVSFCNALSEREGYSQAYVVEGVGARTRVLWDQKASGYRLLTEVEWEYAARAGREGQRHLYAAGSDLEAVAWFSQNAGGETKPVGLKDPNAWGLRDLCGQVWEWCHDEWRRDAYKGRGGEHELSYDPHHYSPLLNSKVVRGGAWYDFASACRLASRPGQDPEARYGVGLRVMRPLSTA